MKTETAGAVDWTLLQMTLGQETALEVFGDFRRRVPRAKIAEIVASLPEGDTRTKLNRFLAIPGAVAGGTPSKGGAQSWIDAQRGELDPTQGASGIAPEREAELLRQIEALEAQVTALTPPPPPSPEALITQGLAELKKELELIPRPREYQAQRHHNWRFQLSNDRAAQAETNLSAKIYEIDTELQAVLSADPAQAALRSWIREAERNLAQYASIHRDAQATRATEYGSLEIYSQTMAARIEYGGLVAHLEKRLQVVRPVVGPLPFGRAVVPGEETPAPAKQMVDQEVTAYLDDLKDEAKRTIVATMIKLVGRTGTLEELIEWRTLALKAAGELRGQLSLGRARGWGYDRPDTLIDARRELERFIAVVERIVEGAGVAV